MSPLHPQQQGLEHGVHAHSHAAALQSMLAAQQMMAAGLHPAYTGGHVFLPGGQPMLSGGGLGHHPGVGGGMQYGHPGMQYVGVLPPVGTGMGMGGGMPPLGMANNNGMVWVLQQQQAGGDGTPYNGHM